MRFRIEIDLDNEAVGESSEVARILRTAAENVRNGCYTFPIQDISGNTVGRTELLGTWQERKVQESR